MINSKMSDRSNAIPFESWKGSKDHCMRLTSSGIDVNIKVNLVSSIFKKHSQKFHCSEKSVGMYREIEILASFLPRRDIFVYCSVISPRAH